MHVYVSNLLWKKDNEGKWVIAKIFTSQGDFNLPSHISEKLDQSLLKSVMDDVKEKVLPQVEEFIRGESD